MAILGTSDHCIATNPSDMNVALMALEATIRIWGKDGEWEPPISEFYRLPGTTPEIENMLKPGDVITRINLKKLPTGSKSTYVKLRDRASYEFALSSAAVIANLQDRKISHIRVTLGGVGTIPWRSPEAEEFLLGKEPTMDAFRKAAEHALKDAKAQTQNKFKIELFKRCLVHALKTVTTI
jgi:xanthine dehydrogenase YagS FAD-binding subunit